MKLLGIGSRINHPKYGKGVVTNVSDRHYWVSFIDTGVETVELDDEFEIIENCQVELDAVSFYEVEKSLKHILQHWSDISPSVQGLGDKWKGGTMSLQPANPDLTAKEIPVETFFHKIVMLRDRLRVMEQKINSNKKLDDSEKVDLQQYITRIYGSLTTFNVLFRWKEDYFVGEGKSKA